MKVAKIRHAFVKLQRIVFTKVSLCLQLHGKQNIFDVVLWFSIVLLLSGDIEINPGPDSVEGSFSSCDTLSATSFETLSNHLSIFHLNRLRAKKGPAPPP